MSYRQEASRKYYQKNRGLILARQKKYNERTKEIRSAYHQEYYQKNKARKQAYKAANRGRWKTNHRKLRYGLSDEDFKRLAVEQSGLCAICKQAVELVIDHNHKTGSVRGLLCKNCNSGIGFLQDSAFVVLSAAAYLFQHET